MINELSERSREIFRLIVSEYMETGAPVGSLAVSRQLERALSPASVRNAMADLEHAGLLFAPHVSAGRLPTQKGLRLFVDGLMEVGNITEDERLNIDAQCASLGRSPEEVYERASTMLSGLAGCMGLVVAPKTDKPLRQIQFVLLEPGKALVVLVMQDGLVENRLMDVPPAMSESTLVKAANFLNQHIAGRTLAEARQSIAAELERARAQLDRLTQDLIERGVAVGGTDGASAGGGGVMIVRGLSHLLEDVRALEDLERARTLFERLEEQENVIGLLEQAGTGEGVQIFIGTEHALFQHSGWSMVISPYAAGDGRIVGAIGVIGPMHINYGRIIPLVDYTARAVGRLLGGGEV